MKPLTRTPLIAPLIALVSLALLLPTAAAAPLAPATVTELPTSWAYGANTSNWANFTNATGNYVAEVHSYFGFQVILNQTNLTGNVTLVELQRTVAFDYQALYCTPTCSNPSGRIYANYTALQVAVGFVNFTVGTVATASGTVPALAVQDSSARVQGTLTERFATGYRNLFGTWKTGNDYLTVQAGAALSLDFTPAFGLLPLNFTGITSWSSSSGYSAAGNWAVSGAWGKNPIFGINTSGVISQSGSLSNTGTVGLAGSVGVPVTLKDAAPTVAVVLVLSGPFDLRDGILFLPVDSDIFGNSPDQSWSSYADASGPASTAFLNIGQKVRHLGVLASATTYQSEATSTFPTSSSSPAIVPALSPAQPTASPQTLQGQPENVTEASQQSGCLSLADCQGQETNLGSGPAKRDWFGAAVVVLAVGVVAALIAVGVVGRRRQLPPPPPRNNASLYPTAAPGVSAPGQAPAPPTARAPPAGNDPLENLW
jgi:hypothetical protein